VSNFKSCIYESRVFHKRVRPKQHRLAYRVFYMLLDLDELDPMHRRLKWFSVNSFNIFSFFDRDHGPGNNEPLRPWVERQLAKADIDLGGGRIRILCLPRILGYVFNPISVFFCYGADETLCAILYEVSNTFGQRHSYLAKISGDTRTPLKHSCEKRLYVSPFMEVTGHYHFTVKQPGEKLLVHIHQTDAEGALLDAWIKGARSPISDPALVNKLLRYPLLTVKVIGGIHWEALKLLTKGVGLKTRPSPPDRTVTIIQD
jgi:DUF1365 family protein